tara:strand:+ start:707 stop:1369 length:663 start_codon:yes stop_codon:yes gene_type:complete
MTFSARRHDLPAAAIAADRPLSGDVMGRSWESLLYLWKVTTNSADAIGSALPAPEGHTHDGVRDQTLAADAEILTGWPCGFGAPHVQGDSSASPNPALPHLEPNGAWADGTAILTPIRSMIHVPFHNVGALGQNALLRSFVLIEKGQTLSIATAVAISVTIGGVTINATSAVAAVGLEIVQVGDWAAGSLAAGGPNPAAVTITVPSGDVARVWHFMAVPV